LVLYYRGAGNALDGLHRLSPFTVCMIFAALMANALAAALRFQLIAAFTGHAVGSRRAMAVVGAGTLAGAAFFQLAGQLMARGFVARQAGMPFAAVVVVTGYERIVAAIMSGLLAIAGAWFIFGKVYLDQAAGGAELVKVACGLVLAATGGALVGYGPTAVHAITPLMTRNFVWRCLGVIGLTLLVQLPMMAAYVVAAHALSPHTPIAGLIAASAVVMFAASVPISLAGWGVREMSAVIALGAIGVAASDALTAAVVIGAGSMLAMAIIAMISLPGGDATKANGELPVTAAIDYSRALALTLPVAAAIFVLFQIYIPVGSGLLNVNLADPIAILGGAFFMLKAFKQRRLPRWRVDHVNISLAAATLSLGLGLLIGAFRFGWTDWALINRFLGWFVLLAFGATGALAVSEGGKDALRIVLLTYAGATAGVALLEVGLVVASALGFWLPHELIDPGSAMAFAQNHNFFAFQLLMALAVTLVIVRESNLRFVLLTLMLTGFWFAGSRSGWISATCVCAAGIYFGSATTRQVVTATICAGCLAAIVAVLSSLHLYELLIGVHAAPSAGFLAPPIVPTEASTHERLISILGGLKLFAAHPLFGAGLGAFRNQMILGSSGLPLLIHSTAVWLLAELGLVGFLIFAVPAAYIWASEWLRARQNQASAVVALCCVAFAVMSGPADMVYQRTFWLLIGAALAVPRGWVSADLGRSPSKMIWSA
jgi:hypothetical protein